MKQCQEPAQTRLSDLLCICAPYLLLSLFLLPALLHCFRIASASSLKNYLKPWSRLLLVHVDEYIACLPSRTYVP